MGAEYANVIVEITHEQVDRFFQYRIPEEWRDVLEEGMQVEIPFGAGNRRITGYVIERTDRPQWDPAKIKPVLGIRESGTAIEGNLIRLAAWLKREYGSTMIQALKTVLPIRKKVKAKEKRYVKALLGAGELETYRAAAEKKHQTARARLAAALQKDPVIPGEVLLHKLNISPATVKAMAEAGVLEMLSETAYRNPLEGRFERAGKKMLNPEQESVVRDILAGWREKDLRPCLIHGVTGSGKTEIYMELMERVIGEGRQVIVLIPEIALTYQTVMRFYRRFGQRVSIINSRLSPGEKYDQFERARQGLVDIMVGPRSALFTPFPRLGLIVIDEEHEGAYQSETAPRYHAREAANQRARTENAYLVLGSATPSLTAYARGQSGEYRLFSLKKRAREGSELAQVGIVDLREELKQGNRSIFSRLLQEKIRERLEKKEQVILFLNRRGYAGFVSCRACGHVLKCPHCDVSLTYHKDGALKCHYCGYEAVMPKLCPACGSPYIAAFGTGTQKAEEMAGRYFPEARILRMDMDTTRQKDGHEKILAAFANHEADILIGTQMIVKGHDFPRVTLVGALAADLSLYTPDYHGAERTFQLLTQAAGRAGRAGLKGEMLIQTYSPEHYSIRTAASQDYEGFYEREIGYRRMLKYPPVCAMLSVLVSSLKEEAAREAALRLADAAKDGENEVIGPAEAPIARVNDRYRQVIYVKRWEKQGLIRLKDRWEELFSAEEKRDLQFQFDFE
ncbi:MAG: primosomal protein N' [Lachnospiraceae bacterium]|nr:primosomal protein N' [Lachnospiraceae bacterium]